MNRNDILEVKKMLGALLKSEGLVQWVGGYVYGRTSNDDPFVILYPAGDHLKEKVCRVYPHQFKKLPDFIPTDQVPADTEANPSKGQAQRAGIYHECPRFKIALYLGKETQMGREKRFSDVLYVPQPTPNGSNGAARPKPEPEPEPAAQETAPDQGADGDDEDARAHWRVEAATAQDPFLFDTAMAKLCPWFRDSNNVKKFRQTLFGEWSSGHTEAYVLALEEYAAQRKKLNGSQRAKQAHEKAKTMALTVLQKKAAAGQGGR